MPSFVSTSRQRFLSLWLRRLSTDRIRRQWRDREHVPRSTSAAPASPPPLRGRDREGGKQQTRGGRFTPLPTPPPQGGREPANASGESATSFLTLREESLRREEPLVIVGRRGNAEQLVAIDDAAEALGLHVGLALAEARAMHPAITAVDEDAHADAALLEAIADWCSRYTPLVAIDGADAALLDISGCAHLFGGEEALLSDLVMRLQRFGFAARAAIADTIGAAWAAARFSDTANIASGAERESLAALPLAALRIDGGMVAVLARVGLKRIADIVDLPRSPLAARFGSGLLRQLDRAFGREREPLSPRLPAPPCFTEQRFAEPIAREEDVLATILRLAQRLRGMLERRGEGARTIELTLFRTDGAVRHIAAGTSRPVRDPQALHALFVERLAALADEWDPGFGFDLVRLAILVAEPAPPEQVSLGGNDDPDALGELIDRLAARFGRHRVARLVARDSHIPELAGASLPAQLDLAQRENGWEAFRRYRDAAVLAPRPLRLLAKPERIAVAPMMVDAPPVRFEWRRAWHEVVAADGPERIEAAWWTDEEGRARDYFRVEDRAGLRFWLFRAGLYRDMEEDDERPRPPLWFMHGLFA